MTEEPEVASPEAISTVRRWMLIVRGLLRAVLTAAVMVTLYYTLPLGSRTLGTSCWSW